MEASPITIAYIQSHFQFASDKNFVLKNKVRTMWFKGALKIGHYSDCLQEHYIHQF